MGLKQGVGVEVVSFRGWPAGVATDRKEAKRLGGRPRVEWPHLAVAPPGGDLTRPPCTPQKPGVRALASPGQLGKQRWQPRGGR